MSGALLTDRNGLCIRAEGSLTSESSGAIAALQAAARTEVEGTDELPTVAVRGDGNVTLIRDEGDLVVAVRRVETEDESA